MEKIKSFVTDLAVCSLPMWFVGIMIVHWFVVGYQEVRDVGFDFDISIYLFAIESYIQIREKVLLIAEMP